MKHFRKMELTNILLEEEEFAFRRSLIKAFEKEIRLYFTCLSIDATTLL